MPNKIKIDNRVGGQKIDLNQLFDEDYETPLSMTKGDDWNAKFEKQCLVSNEDADAYFRRIEASVRKCPI